MAAGSIAGFLLLGAAPSQGSAGQHHEQRVRLGGRNFAAAAGLWADSVSAAAVFGPAAGLGRVTPRERDENRRCGRGSGRGGICRSSFSIRSDLWAAVTTAKLI